MICMLILLMLRETQVYSISLMLQKVSIISIYHYYYQNWVRAISGGQMPLLES